MKKPPKGKKSATKPAPKPAFIRDATFGECQTALGTGVRLPGLRYTANETDLDNAYYEQLCMERDD